MPVLKNPDLFVLNMKTYFLENARDKEEIKEILFKLTKYYKYKTYYNFLNVQRS